jgi:hypothetical protein
MPTISIRSGSFFGTASFNDPSIWIGGIVPTASDTVFIYGLRKAMSGNIMYWPGTASFVTLNNITQLPDSGSLYTYTDRDVEVKIDYNGLSGSNILNCVIDKAYSAPWGQGDYNLNLYPFPDKRGGVIPNGAYVLFRPGEITISGSNTASVLDLYVGTGGKFILKDTSSFSWGRAFQIQDGLFKAHDYSTIQSNTPVSASVSQSFGSTLYFTNEPFTQVYLEGLELRTNTTLSLAPSIGDSYLSVISASNFEVGDWVFVGEEDIRSTREDDGLRAGNQAVGGFNGNYSYNVSSEDECFYVAAKDTGSIPNRLYVQRMNGLEGKIIATASSTELIVDEERYQVGDKVFINGQTRTITQVTSSYDYLLASYDFTNPTASLNDWDIDGTKSPALANWVLSSSLGLIPGIPAINSTFKHTYLKNIFRDNVKIEATVVNNNAGRDISRYGIVIHADPTLDYPYTSIPSVNQESFRTYFIINPSNGTAFLALNQNLSVNQSSQPLLANISNIEETHKLTLECSRGFTKAYIDDIKFSEEVNRSGVFAGRVGLVTENVQVIYKDFKVYAKCQKITLDSPVSNINPNDILYETGIELPHAIGDKVIKLSSFIDNELAHKNLAFGYKGAPEFDNNGIYPYIWGTNNVGQKNGIGNITSSLVLNDINNFTFFGSSSGSKSLVVDLITPTTFSYFGVCEGFYVNFQNYTSSISGGISFSGSNDAINWTPITGGIQDPRSKTVNQTIRYFEFNTPQTYRYLRFQTQGITNAGVSDTNFAVHNIYIGSGSLNRINVNNASDFNIGDFIQFHPKTQTLPHILGGQDSVNSFVFFSGSSLLLEEDDKDYYVVTGKSGNTLTLNKRVTLNLTKGTHVVKINKSVQISGSYTTGSVRAIRMNGGQLFNPPSFQNFLNRMHWKNVSFSFITKSYPVLPIADSQTSTYDSRWNFGYNNVWEPFRVQGCSFFGLGNDGGGINVGWVPNGNGWWSGVGNGATAKYHINFRHNSITGLGRIRPYGWYSAKPHIITGNIIYNNTVSYSNNGSYSNSSYNFMYSSNDFEGVENGPTVQFTNYMAVELYPLGSLFKQNRNLYRSAGVMFLYSEIGNGPDTYITFEVKNNKLENLYYFTNAQISYRGISSFPIENQLLPNRGGMDGYKSSTNRWRFGTIGNATNQIVGLPQSYMKNYNRYGYDVWLNTRGWVIKENNDSWYKFYHFSSSMAAGGLNFTDFRSPFIGAQINVFEDVTCSFNLSFDYYNDMTQVTQTNGYFIQDNDTNAQGWNNIIISGGQPPFNYTTIRILPVSASYVGGLSTFMYKNGRLINWPKRIIKSLTPTTYQETFTLDGKGIYYIALSQDAPGQGFVALKNISSNFNDPSQTGSIVLSNYFSMKYFNGAEEVQFRNFTKENEPPSTFRLKGTRLS